MSSGPTQPDVSAEAADLADEPTADGPPVAVGEYTWADYMREHGHGDEVERAYRTVDEDGDRKGDLRSLGSMLGWDENGRSVPTGDDWDRVTFDPAAALGFPPEAVDDHVRNAAAAGARLQAALKRWIAATPVTRGEYTWEHFKWEYYYDEQGRRPRDARGNVRPFDPESYLGFDPEEIEDVLETCSARAKRARVLEDRRTVNVNPEVDEDEFFSTAEGHTTLANRYDLEKAVPMAKKLHFEEVERYWVDKPNAFVVLFHSRKENEGKYYLVDPYLNEIEEGLVEYLAQKLRTAIKYSDDELVVEGPREGRKAAVLEREITRFLDRYDLRVDSTGGPMVGLVDRLVDGPGDGLVDRLRRFVDGSGRLDDEEAGGLDGIAARPEPAVLAEDSPRLTEYQVEKLLYVLKRDFIGYERIDGIKHDINVEDISCDGYDSPVFVYHTDYENVITNVHHGETELDDFVVKLAQRSGKGISKRNPQVDATLPDGSRAQLTLGREVSDHGTNYTIRQFKDVPFTPVDQVNWNTFSLDEMAFLWLCIENNKSLIFAGGTASGKTTALNAVSLFIPSSAKIVSIEDTREVELPHRNWVASVTRPSFREDGTGDVDEFDLLEAALRQRPEYIVMGEVRGEEGRDLFQVMSTGHTSYSTFHADSVGEVLKRFTTDPINVSKTMFTALDLVAVQTMTRVQGRKVRRNKTITEINDYDTENDEISVQDVYQWQPEPDEFRKLGQSTKLEEIAFDRGWSRERLDEELFKRRVILAYLIHNDLNEYTQVAATIQAFINDPETILTLIANDQLEPRLEDLREMESVLIDADPAKEAMVPRPSPDQAVREETERILDRAADELLAAYEGEQPSALVDTLPSPTGGEEILVTPDGVVDGERGFDGERGSDGEREFDDREPPDLPPGDPDAESEGAGGDGESEGRDGGGESEGADRDGESAVGESTDGDADSATDGDDN